MFKGLVQARPYSLSDGQLEFQIEDRRSFQYFIGLPDAKHAPDRNSFWLFREAVKDLKLTEKLIHEFNRPLGGRVELIARLVKVPVQRNTPDENAHKLVRKYTVTDASAAYRSEADLQAQGYSSRIHRKSARGKPVDCLKNKTTKPAARSIMCLPG